MEKINFLFVYALWKSHNGSYIHARNKKKNYMNGKTKKHGYTCYNILRKYNF